MDPSLFDELQRTFITAGPEAAIEHLCERTRQQKDYGNLFYALLMKKRFALGVSPIPTGPAQELPESTHAEYEDAIRHAGRLVGSLYLEEGNIAQAWVYFRMLGEPDPVAKALEAYQPGEGDEIQPVVHLAFYEGVHPRRGFELILQRYGLCNAITTLSSQELPHPPEVRAYCIGRLIHTLYEELSERLRADIERHEGKAPPSGTSIRELIAGRDFLFEEDFAHVDMSHLSSVVQMSLHLAPGKELDMARELCAYGQRLTPRLQYPGDPPFEDQYRDYGVYLAIIAGENVEEGIHHFRAKAEQADPETVGTFPAEVLVNLLLRLDRPVEALAVAKRFLSAVENRRLSCPSIPELCQRANDFATLTAVAREQGDAVHFLAGLLASRS